MARKFVQIDTLRRCDRRFPPTRRRAKSPIGRQSRRKPQTSPDRPGRGRDVRQIRGVDSKRHDRRIGGRDVAKKQRLRFRLVVVRGVEFSGPMRRVAAKSRVCPLSGSNDWAGSTFS
jgi:hypothetical protein